MTSSLNSSKTSPSFNNIKSEDHRHSNSNLMSSPTNVVHRENDYYNVVMTTITMKQTFSFTLLKDAYVEISRRSSFWHRRHYTILDSCVSQISSSINLI